ncbi:hypothetical protein PV326_012876, partial [Microctonus aethiopoides]
EQNFDSGIVVLSATEDCTMTMIRQSIERHNELSLFKYQPAEGSRKRRTYWLIITIRSAAEIIFQVTIKWSNGIYRRWRGTFRLQTTLRRFSTYFRLRRSSRSFHPDIRGQNREINHEGK